MKKSFLIIALAALSFTACTSKKSEHGHEHDADGKHTETKGQHVHEDGSVHDDHLTNDSTNQEEFKVKEDSTAHGHDHGDSGHKH